MHTAASTVQNHGAENQRAAAKFIFITVGICNGHDWINLPGGERQKLTYGH